LKTQFVFHPILIALFPVLLIYSQNQHLILFEGIIFPLLIILSVAIVFWIGLKFVLKNLVKSAIITSLYTILFFSYGHIFNIINSNFSLDNPTYAHFSILIPFTILVIILTYYFIKTKRKLNNFTSIINMMSIALVAFIIFNISLFSFQNEVTTLDSQNDNFNFENKISLENKPNVYYIIMDEYAPLRILEKIYEYDNSDFVNFLKDKNFYVAKNSHTNYGETFLVLASTLNMKYLNYLTDVVGSDSIDQRIPYQMINENFVMKNFKALGYKIYNFDSGWWGTRNIQIADENLCLTNQNMDFHTLYELKQTSILRSVDLFIKKPTQQIFHEERRDRIHCQFNTIMELSEKTNYPIFALMHVMAPHDPYVFGPNGEPVDYDYTFAETAKKDSLNKSPNVKAYLDQSTYLNKLLKETVTTILDRSDNSIIIIQSDTGPDVTFSNLTDEQHKLGRMSIFNAYYFPEQKYGLLHHEITPVNLFRVIFDSHFETNYGLLDDEVFFSTYEKPYVFEQITDYTILP